MTAFDDIANEICALAKKLTSDEGLHAPFVYNGWRYATDARIVVREKADVADALYPTKAPLVEALGWNAVFAEAVALPSPLPPRPPCSTCGDTRLVTPACDDCDGAGEQTCDMGYRHVCTVCKGKPSLNSLPCDVCALPARWPVCISSRPPRIYVNGLYLHLLARHGIAALCPCSACPATRPLRFGGPGFDGLLMPIPP